MATKWKMIGGQMLPFDADTGELLVKDSVITLDADTNVQDRQAITATAALLASGGAYRHWLIWPDSGSADIHLRFTEAGTDATTSEPKFGEGDVCKLHFDTAQKCSMIGAFAYGNVNFIAW